MRIAPILCGDTATVHIPDVECTDCEVIAEELERFETEMTECCNEVKTTLTGKQDSLSAGSNITIENNVISATGVGLTPEDVERIVTDMLTPEVILAILGYGEIELAMTDDVDTTNTWAVVGKEIV